MSKFERGDTVKYEPNGEVFTVIRNEGDGKLYIIIQTGFKSVESIESDLTKIGTATDEYMDELRKFERWDLS